MILPLETDCGKAEERQEADQAEVLELIEVDDVLEVEGFGQGNSLVAHSLEESRGSLNLIGIQVLELGIGDQDGTELGVFALDLQGHPYRVEGFSVTQPFLPKHPAEDD